MPDWLIKIIIILLFFLVTIGIPALFMYLKGKK